MKEVNLTKRALLLMVVAVALLAGCSSSNVDKSIAQIEKAIKKVEKNKANMTESDWQAFVSEIQKPYEVLDKAVKEDKVGALKKIKILAVTTKLMVVVGEAGFGSKEGFETLMKATKEKQSSENK
jgi:major membrane immunogen (membrane-anchored lipoprotein)